MADKARRKRPARAAKQARSDQRSDPKPTQYRIRRKIPDPAWSLSELVRPHVPKSPRRAKVSDEQLAIAPVETVSPEEAQPFLKWVGGKAQILAQLDEFFPVEIGRYVEPFIGGGAVFFHLKQRFPQMRAFLRDNNDELINAYQAVRNNPRELMRRLDRHLAAFLTRRAFDFSCSPATRVGHVSGPHRYTQVDLCEVSESGCSV